MWTKNIQTYLLWGLIGIFVGYVIFGKSDIDVDIESYQTEINLLQQKIDSINIYNSELKLEADSLSTKLVEYDTRIQKLNTTITVIQNDTQKKIDSVDFFGDDELERFFAERYKYILERFNTDTINQTNR
jgi:regulator of replication initiation timing